MVKGCKIILYLNLSHTHITDASLRTISKWVGYFIHRHVYTDHHYVSTPHTDASLQTISKSEPHTQTSSSRPSQIQTFTQTPPISKWEPNTKTHFTVQRHLLSNHLRFICVQRYLTLNQPDQHKFSYQVLVILILQVW